jgi:hypothetical protein
MAQADTPRGAVGALPKIAKINKRQEEQVDEHLSCRLAAIGRGTFTAGVQSRHLMDSV